MRGRISEAHRFLMGLTFGLGLFALLAIVIQPSWTTSNGSLVLRPSWSLWGIAAGMLVLGALSLAALLLNEGSSESNPFLGGFSSNTVLRMGSSLGLLIGSGALLWGIGARCEVSAEGMKWRTTFEGWKTYSAEDIKDATLRLYLRKGKPSPYTMTVSFADGRKWNSLRTGLVDPSPKLKSDLAKRLQELGVPVAIERE